MLWTSSREAFFLVALGLGVASCSDTTTPAAAKRDASTEQRPMDAGAPDPADADADAPEEPDVQPSGIVVYRAGATEDARVSPAGGTLLAGGGADVDEAMQVAIAAADHGDVVVLRMDDTGGGYGPYLVGLGAHRATEIVFDPAGGNDTVLGVKLDALRALASSRWVERRIDEAELVFFAGGNQTKYVDVFTGTRVATAVVRLARERRGVVGGTSAGMHVLGGLVHTPRGAGNSVTSALALQDPYIAQDEHPGTASLELSKGPFALPGMENLVFDTHFANRARFGRSITFLARVIADSLLTLGAARVVACDERTAVFVDGTGKAMVYGQGDATILRARNAPEVCADNVPLSWNAGVDVTRVAGRPPAAVDFDGTLGRQTRASVVSGAVTER